MGCPAQTSRWSEQKAEEWYAKQPWLVGSNYIPATSINELEMWQAETFDRSGSIWSWAGRSRWIQHHAGVPHDLLWQHDRSFKSVWIFLNIAKKHHIRPLFVLFDSCWGSQS